jgi:2-octaprenyl-6-methoxyphenol hydroxylase
MKKQKICIIGGGLTGLVTAISLSKLNCSIDLITGNAVQNLKSNRTIAVSENNFDFLNKLNISESLKREVWTCSIMKLYTEIKNEKFSKIFELNNENKQEKILYMLENSKIMKLMMSKIQQIKSISVKNHKKVSSISTSGLLKSVKFNNNISKYNLVIICTGYNSSLIKNLFNDQMIKNSYKESAITTILSHSSHKNNTVRQIFLENEILALLPISNTKTSIVWFVKNDVRKKNDLFLKKKIKLYAKNYLKNIKFATNIEYKGLNLLIRNKYYLDRTLLFGDALHVIHPFVGQGFNMTLKDLACLEKILTQKINLGLDIGSLDVLSEFSSETKPRNFAFSVGVDLLKNSFSYKKLRNSILMILNKSNFAKDIFFEIANKGFRF